MEENLKKVKNEKNTDQTLKKNASKTLMSINKDPLFLSTTKLVSIYRNRFKTNKANVYDVAKETPLTVASNLSDKLSRNVFLKREDLQPAFSFKLRGAYNRMQQLNEIEQKNGVIACSAGNHAQGLKATIVMPLETPSLKVKNVIKLGGKVVLFGKDFDEAKQECKRLSLLEGLTIIHPFDDPYVIAGQGTIAPEIFRQHDPKDISAIFVCIGGGGLICGIAAYTKKVFPHIKIIGVEAFDAAGMTSSLEVGKIVNLSTVGLFADGAAVRSVGNLNFLIAKDLIDGTVLVSTDEICAAIKDVFEDTRSIVEPAGALAVAGLKKYIQHLNLNNENLLEVGKNSLVAICSGANMNFDRLKFVAERADLGEDLEVLISVVIPEKPGTFVQLYKAISPRKITEFVYRYENTEKANVILSFKVNQKNVTREEDVETVFRDLNNLGFFARDLSYNEMAKAHARYFGGGRKKVPSERHYRYFGGDTGTICLGIQVLEETRVEFESFIQEFPFHSKEETNNEVYQDFLT
ncbi:hypothetical protein HK099_002175 [Clydaea vesicula]|uniref:Threonine dehydratase n=1 Tax=Clydaea vesicula TaxID=447962 RepID=A0AAD5UB94_9FUNG|nr:hypothetical protein HK099_002175 [Clydaea vesicula]